MKGLLAASALAITLLLATPGASSRTTLDIAGPTLPAYVPGAQSSVYLKLSNGACTGTIIGRRAILTATHCLEDGRRLVAVNDRPMEGRIIANDGNDHVILLTTRPIEGRIAKVSLAPPANGQDLYLWGNTLGGRAMLRRGYMLGRYKDYLLFDIDSWYGDSGAGVFDRHGNVVAVVYGGAGENSPVGSIKLMLAEPIAFTEAHLKRARES
jgi:hypothetical protein